MTIQTTRYTLKKARSVLITVLVILALFSVVLVVLGPWFGVRTDIVLSGSMEPAIGTGSVIITRPVAPEDIQIGDIILFTSRSGASIITHRVIGIEQTPELQFITKGDANRDRDPTPIPARQVIGTLFLAIPYLGYLVTSLRTPLGILFLIGIPAGILVANELKTWIERGKQV
jgi:signal peptidase